MDSHLDPTDVTGVQRDVPPLGKIHRRRVGFLVLDETDPHNNLVFVS
jgi:hypothetical protein